jgi:hypothetical protein
MPQLVGRGQLGFSFALYVCVLITPNEALQDNSQIGRGRTQNEHPAPCVIKVGA